LVLYTLRVCLARANHRVWPPAGRPWVASGTDADPEDCQFWQYITKTEANRCEAGSVTQLENSTFMDFVGATSSVLTLVEVSISTFRIIDSVIRSYCNAPAELLSLKHDLDGLSSQLILLKQIDKFVSFTTLGIAEEEFSHLERFLKNNSQFYIDIRDFFTRQTLHRKSGRVKWALTTSRRVAKWKQDVQRHSLDLSQIMVLLNVFVISTPKTNGETHR
jgi:hypothetical protein